MLDLNFFLDPSQPARFKTVTMEVEIKTNATEEQVHQLHEDVKIRCPVYNMLALAGVKMESHWKKI